MGEIENMKRIRKRLVVTSLLFAFATLGAGLASSMGRNVSEVKAGTATSTLSFVNGNTIFADTVVPKYSGGHAYTDTKQFADLEWSLVVQTLAGSDTTVIGNPGETDYLQVGTEDEEMDFFQFRSQLIGGNKPVVTAIDITVKGVCADSHIEVAAGASGDMGFVTDHDNNPETAKISRVTVTGTAEETIHFVMPDEYAGYGLEGAFGEIIADFENVSGGALVKSVVLTLSSYNPEGSFAFYYEAFAFASKVQMGDPCVGDEEEMAALIAEYDALIARGEPIADMLPDLQFYDREVIDGPRTYWTDVGEKMDYIRSRYGDGGSGAKVVNAEAASSNMAAMASVVGTAVIFIAFGAFAIRKRKRN